MLRAKLKNPVKYQVQILPNKFEERVGDFISVSVDGYVLGIKNFMSRVILEKEYLEELNPASELQEEQFYIKKYELLNIYQVELNEEELSEWGYDDSELLYVVAKKLGLEVIEVIDAELENKETNKNYTELVKQREQKIK